MSVGFDPIPQFIRESSFCSNECLEFLFWVLGLGAVILPQELHCCKGERLIGHTHKDRSVWQGSFFMKCRLRKNSWLT
jgi:hypothetical protein